MPKTSLTETQKLFQDFLISKTKFLKQTEEILEYTSKSFNSIISRAGKSLSSLTIEEKKYLSEQVLQKGITFYIQKALRGMQREKEREFQYSQQLIANPRGDQNSFWGLGFSNAEKFAEFMKTGVSVVDVIGDMRTQISDDLTCLEKLGRFEISDQASKKRSKVVLIRIEQITRWFKNF